MKTLLSSFFLILLLYTLSGCRDLLENKDPDEEYVYPDTIHVEDTNPYFSQILKIPVKTTTDYSVTTAPVWLKLIGEEGNISPNLYYLTFSLVPAKIPAADITLYGKIVLALDIGGTITINVACLVHFHPEFYVSPSVLEFNMGETMPFTIGNKGGGILNWRADYLPNWLRVSEMSGSLKSGESKSLKLVLDSAYRNSVRDLECRFQIITVSPDGNYNVDVLLRARPVIREGLKPITGIVTDAEYCHETGLMAICTVSPNTLRLFNTYSKTDTTVNLDQPPACISVSADGHIAAIAYSTKSIDYFDLENLNKIRNYDIDCAPVDIALGENGWCYVTPVNDQRDRMRSLNLNTGELIVSSQEYMSEKTLIKKIPGKSYLAGTWSSSLLFLKIDQGPVNDTIIQYYHFAGNLWISSDASRIYSASGYIYQIPPLDGIFNPNDIPVLGYIPDMMYYSGFDDCPVINSVFSTSVPNDYYEGATTYIHQYNSTSLSLVRSYNISAVALTENETTKYYEVSPRFLFVNKEGTKLYVIKDLKQEYGRIYWSMEEIPAEPG